MHNTISLVIISFYFISTDTEYRPVFSTEQGMLISAYYCYFSITDNLLYFLLIFWISFISLSFCYFLSFLLFIIFLYSVYVLVHVVLILEL